MRSRNHSHPGHRGHILTSMHHDLCSAAWSWTRLLYIPPFSTSGWLSSLSNVSQSETWMTTTVAPSINTDVRLCPTWLTRLSGTGLNIVPRQLSSLFLVCNASLRGLSRTSMVVWTSAEGKLWILASYSHHISFYVNRTTFFFCNTPVPGNILMLLITV